MPYPTFFANLILYVMTVFHLNLRLNIIILYSYCCDILCNLPANILYMDILYSYVKPKHDYYYIFLCPRRIKLPIS